MKNIIIGIMAIALVISAGLVAIYATHDSRSTLEIGEPTMITENIEFETVITENIETENIAY